ncbi:hypothetical protein RFI_28133 [Reticulomyxa filosa]|uniref:Transmembrane protein n=1 Tax=Reticulomyxa filosa TaxID=46433 RepID=X6M5Q2_RETFI|nr:hypothetical protein RFI_28133 [Reticulomyxa filosa]|eukprot:ETO09254.1 hypothetical protein RFI_28133 [Reticulomyxa filosa]
MFSSIIDIIFKSLSLWTFEIDLYALDLIFDFKLSFAFSENHDSNQILYFFSLYNANLIFEQSLCKFRFRSLTIILFQIYFYIYILIYIIFLYTNFIFSLCYEFSFVDNYQFITYSIGFVLLFRVIVYHSAILELMGRVCFLVVSDNYEFRTIKKNISKTFVFMIFFRWLFWSRKGKIVFLLKKRYDANFKILLKFIFLYKKKVLLEFETETSQNVKKKRILQKHFWNNQLWTILLSRNLQQTILEDPWRERFC